MTHNSGRVLAANPDEDSTTLVTVHQTPKKAALASLLGSTLEYYDFVIYGTAAALFFNKLFFPEGNAVVAMIASLASFGVAYVARPIGGLVMGHIGDSIGRKKALMITLVVMGIASVSIGLLPTYGQVGIWATVLLFVCRIAQGFSAGAESAGASTMTMEHSPEGRRGLFTSSVMIGCAVGNVLAGLVFMPFLALPEEQLMAWGWRIPFLLSAVVLAVAYYIRTELEEPEAVAAEAEQEEEESSELQLAEYAPAVEVLKFHVGKVARVFFTTWFSFAQTGMNVYAMSYATQVVGIARPTVVMTLIVGNAISIVFIPIWAWLSDKYGRKPILLFAAVFTCLTFWAFFSAANAENIPMMMIWCGLNQGVFYAAWNGVWTIFFPEMFPAKVRYTGMAMGNQLGLILVGFTPAIATAIEARYHWVGVAVYVTFGLVVAGIAIATAKETAFTKLEDLGK